MVFYGDYLSYSTGFYGDFLSYSTGFFMVFLDPILVVFPAISDLIPVLVILDLIPVVFYGDFILFHWFFMVILDLF